MFPTLWNDITSFSWTQHLICETGVQADAQGFVRRREKLLQIRHGNWCDSVCVETCSGNVAQASLNLIPPASAFVCCDGGWVPANIFELLVLESKLLSSSKERIFSCVSRTCQVSGMTDIMN